MRREKARLTHVARPGPTLSDVARAAGVTVGTASKALNGQGKLRAETRALVQDVATRLGFRPNGLAQSLLRGRTFTVGLLSTDKIGRFSIPLVTGIEDVLGDAQISVFLCNTLGDPTSERHHIDSLLSKQVDGIIVAADGTNVRDPIDVGNVTVPTLYVFTRVETPDACCLLTDDEQGARLAIEHLLGLGRRRIAHITGPVDFVAAQMRAKSMRRVLTEAGMPFVEKNVLSGPWQESWGYEAANTLLERDSTIDAIFCGNDQIARGAEDALRERGVRVPDDIAIIGFDNWETIAEAARPPLTTVDMNLHELGRSAGAKILAMIEGEQDAGVIRYPCSLIIRESCGATSKRSKHVEG